MTKKLFFYALTINIALFGLIINSNPVSALSGSDFNPGNIIDDTLFYDGSAMTAGEIQAFLNSKVPSCDTSGSQSNSYYFNPSTGEVNNNNQVWDGDQWVTTSRSVYGSRVASYLGESKGSRAPYTCLKDFRQNTGYKAGESGLCSAIEAKTNRSAAEIIDDVARACHVSQKVLIVMLQKEQGLVTDDWPWGIQYTKAMGYYCPDDPNNPGWCHPNYAGFFNQVYNAALQFQLYKADPGNWNHVPSRYNNILYQANASSCGSRSVYIENYATAGLYNYTPYTPNQAALNNLYGTGDSCSAYGNRNFWRYFNDWFGSTRAYFGNKPSWHSLYARSACNIRYFSSDFVGRLYKPDTQDFIYTRDYSEACRLVTYGYIWDDVVMQNAAGGDAIPVYRLSNPVRNVFTTSVAVKNDAIATNGYSDLGIAFYVYSTPTPSDGTVTTPVFGLQRSDTFFITSSGKEAEYYTSQYGYYSFGTVFYTRLMYGQPSTVYRLMRNNQRIYTPHQNEVDSAKHYGYIPEGSVATNDTKPDAGNMPVFRISLLDGTYLYTTSRFERDLAVINYDASAVGIPFYSLMWSSEPVLRASHPYSGFRIFATDISEYNAAINYYNYVGDGIGWYSY